MSGERIVSEHGLVSIIPLEVLEAKALELLRANPKTTATDVAAAFGQDTKAKDYKPSDAATTAIEVATARLKLEAKPSAAK
jgi:hypothetical protein